MFVSGVCLGIIGKLILIVLFFIFSKEIGFLSKSLSRLGPVLFYSYLPYCLSLLLLYLGIKGVLQVITIMTQIIFDGS